MSLTTLELTRAHHHLCKAEFATGDAVQHLKGTSSRDAQSNALGSIHQAITETKAALKLLEADRDQLANNLQTSHHTSKP